MKRVLFLCAPNSPHSIIAEALLCRIDSRNFEGYSARGSFEQVDPLTVEVMKEIGIDLSQRIPKTLEELYGVPFDFLITLDDSTAKEVNPIAAADVIHWRVDTLRAHSGEGELKRRELRSVRDQIAQRLRLFTIVYTRPSVFTETRLAG